MARGTTKRKTNMDEELRRLHAVDPDPKPDPDPEEEDEDDDE